MGPVLEVIDVAAARRWAVSALTCLGRAREEIDALNVFPVPDGDTGTNLYLTLEAACSAVATVPGEPDLRAVAEAFARGALFGARGSSGVIMAQMLRGWADVLGECGRMDGDAVRDAFTRADSQAWSAVSEPMEGTILSVSRAAVGGAVTAGPGLGDVVTAALARARQALVETRSQLEPLRRAGVVDAGGRGLVVLLETLAALVHGHSAAGDHPDRGYRRPALPPVDLSRCGQPRPSGPAYEVMYLLDAPGRAIPALRQQLAPLGDSLMIIGGGSGEGELRSWNVHVHVDDPGAAVEAGVQVGRPYHIRITHFADQMARRHSAHAEHASVGLVACAAGPGLAGLFRQVGATVVSDPAGRRPTTEAILAAVRGTRAETVVVLPNAVDTVPVAEAAAAEARAEGVRVSVLPTRAQVQGLAAAAVHDPSRGFDDDVVRMSAAAGATRDGGVTLAGTSAITSSGSCRVGDCLGVVQGDVAVIGTDPRQVVVEVVDRLLAGGGELVTLVLATPQEQGLADAVQDHLRSGRRDVEVHVLVGGQARYLVLIGVE
jgi:DAK2 domain fusion protein YloV